MQELLFTLPDDTPAAGSLADRYIVPPISVIDRRMRRWQDRSRRLRESLSIQSEVGRARDLTYDWGPSSQYLQVATRVGGTSIFDPALCELAYYWYTRPGDHILDPFAGGSVRGTVAQHMGRRYTGLDIRAEQVEANRGAATGVAPVPEWITADSAQWLPAAPHQHADLVFTCPPYGDLEVYSDDPDDLSTMPEERFRQLYRDILTEAARHLLLDRYMVVIIGDVRRRDGSYWGLPALTQQIMVDAGLILHSDAVILDPLGTVQMRAELPFRGSRKLGRTHQYMLVAVKGDMREATRRLPALAGRHP